MQFLVKAYDGERMLERQNEGLGAGDGVSG